MSIYSNAYSPPTNDANTILRDLQCDASVQVGDAVRVSSGVIVQALADTFANANILGICESKANPTTCDVRVSGVIVYCRVAPLGNPCDLVIEELS